MSNIICTPLYPNKFKPGDIAISKISVKFCCPHNDKDHSPGDEILVTKENNSYFNVHYMYYDLKEV